MVSTPHTCRLAIFIEEEVLAIRGCLSRPVPHLGFPLIDADSCVHPQLVLQRLLDSCDSCWRPSDVHVIQEGEKSPSALQRFLTLLTMPGVALMRRGTASTDHLVPFPRPAESHEPPHPRLPTNGLKTGVELRNEWDDGITIRHPVEGFHSWLCVRSNRKPSTPSINNTVNAALLSVKACTTCAMLS